MKTHKIKQKIMTAFVLLIIAVIPLGVLSLPFVLYKVITPKAEQERDRENLGKVVNYFLWLD